MLRWLISLALAWRSASTRLEGVLRRAGERLERARDFRLSAGCLPTDRSQRHEAAALGLPCTANDNGTTCQPGQSSWHDDNQRSYTREPDAAQKAAGGCLLEAGDKPETEREKRESQDLELLVNGADHGHVGSTPAPSYEAIQGGGSETFQFVTAPENFSPEPGSNSEHEHSASRRSHNQIEQANDEAAALGAPSSIHLPGACPSKDSAESNSAPAASGTLLEVGGSPSGFESDAQRSANRGAVYKDRRGAKRQAAKPTGAPNRTRTPVATKRAELRLRLVVDAVLHGVELSAVLARGPDFPERVRTGFGNPVELLALDGRFDDLPINWTPSLLRSELRLADEQRAVEWVRGARDIHLFAEESGESDLMSVPAALLGRMHAIVCPTDCVPDILAIAVATQSPAPRILDGWTGIPDGWTVVDGYRPQAPAEPRPEGRLQTLDPGTNFEIAFEGGLLIRSRTWAAGRPPIIRISALPPNGAVYIDNNPGSVSEDGICTAQNWDQPGTHLVDVVPGNSASYAIAPDPAYAGGWESTAGFEVELGSICGAQVVSPNGDAVVAYPVAGLVVALGKRSRAKTLEIRSGLHAAIGALHFKPEFLIVSWGRRRAQGEIIWLASSGTEPPGPPDAAWASAVRNAAARNLAIRPASEEARKAWASATSLARTYRKGRI